MLGLALKVLLGAAAVVAGVTAACVVIYVVGKITIRKLKEIMLKRRIKKALVKAVDRNTNTVRIEDMEDKEEIEVHGDDGVSMFVHEGQTITA